MVQGAIRTGAGRLVGYDAGMMFSSGGITDLQAMIVYPALFIIVFIAATFLYVSSKRK